MTYAILCPGPSLSTFADSDHEGPIITVNRSGLLYPSEVWAATDYPMIRNNYEAVKGNPNLLTRRQTAADLPAFRKSRFARVEIVEEIVGVPVGLNWQDKTMTCAMIFAFVNGASKIDIYGCDWTGEADYDGVLAGEDRSESRWAKERAVYDGIVDWLKGKGVEVRRMGQNIAS
jgi:hypothetical protein